MPYCLSPLNGWYHSHVNSGVKYHGSDYDIQGLQRG